MWTLLCEKHVKRLFAILISMEHTDMNGAKNILLKSLEMFPLARETQLMSFKVFKWKSSFRGLQVQKYKTVP